MLTLRPRADRFESIPRQRTGSIAARRGASAWSWTRLGGLPPLWLLLPAGLVVVCELLPLLYLALRTLEDGGSAWQLLARARTLEVVLNSVLLAGAVAVATLVIGVPLAWLTSRTDLPGRELWGTVVALPLVIPSYIGAVVMVAAFGPRGMLQAALAPLGIERLPSLF